MNTAPAEVSNTTAPVPPPASETITNSQRWTTFLDPVLTSVTTAVTNTQTLVEKRIGFCPGKEVLKAASKGLDVLGHGLLDLSAVLSKLAGGDSKDGGSQQA